MLLFAAAVVVMFLRVPEFRGWFLGEMDKSAVESAPSEPAVAPDSPHREPESVTDVEPFPGAQPAPPDRGHQDLGHAPIDPIADFARYIAQRHRAWRTGEGEFITARDLAALYGLDVYALPKGERPPSPGITAVALKLGYFVTAPRFVDALVAQGEKLRPLDERNLAEGAENGAAEHATESRGDWTRDLLERTARKARELAACREADPLEEGECHFVHAFMDGLAGSEADADRLRTSAAEALLDMAARLETRAAKTDAAGKTASP
ncbi:MAG: hypothetical protein ACOCWR_05830 [Oceanidesulfovibrio sp.]